MNAAATLPPAPPAAIVQPAALPDPTLPRVHAFHRLANGRYVSAGALARAVRIARSQPLEKWYPVTLCSQFGGTGREFLQDFSRYCEHEINRRGGRVIPDTDTPARQARQFARLCARARPSSCKWCGQTLAAYVPQEWQRFCPESDCRRAYAG